MNSQILFVKHDPTLQIVKVSVQTKYNTNNFFFGKIKLNFVLKTCNKFLFIRQLLKLL